MNKHRADEAFEAHDLRRKMTNGVSHGVAAVFASEKVREEPVTKKVRQHLARGSRARVLVVDSNGGSRERYSRVLSRRWRVDVASDGPSALELVRRQRFDIVVLDTTACRSDAEWLMRELRKTPAAVAAAIIAIVPPLVEEADEEADDDIEADDFVVHPVSGRELTARIATCLELRSLHEHLSRTHAAEAANRAKDEFLAMLGHELRNPLSPILTALQLMRLRGSPSREQDIIERQVGHLTRLVDDLLDVSRIARGKMVLRRKNVEVADAVARAIEMAMPLLEQRRDRLEVDVPRSGLVVHADPDRIAQVFANLLTNAAKYSKVGSCIFVKAERDADTICIRVRDEGVGIRPDMLGKVFELFVQQPQTVDGLGGGLGVGLAIVKSLAELHGGRVSARSEGPCKGTEFVVELPAVRHRAADEPASEPHARASGARRSARILVVDDNDDAAEVLKEALVRLGYLVELAHDGPTALEIAKTFHPEVALLDIGLPVMDGYELAQRLGEMRATGQELHLVAVTGYGQQTDRARSAAAGFECHLVKPVDLTKLERVVEGLRRETA